jgi:hypothetical protein
MKKSVGKKLKKIFNLYNLAILICLILIIVSLIVIINPDFSSLSNIFKKETVSVSEEDTKTVDDVKVVSNKSDKEISEKEARSLAKKQFKELGEKVKEDDLEVLKIQREGEEYYYISSAENTLEIKISSGDITRINSVKVED